MTERYDLSRRQALKSLGLAGAGVLLGGVGAAAEKPQQEEAEQVTPAEDLMREHGALRRILLIYRYYGDRLAGTDAVDFEPLKHAARLVRTFVEDYHEKLEETYLFPRFRKAGQLVALVDTLQAQHNAGRRLTAEVIDFHPGITGGREPLRANLAQFLRMYEPHAAREDTVLFPAFAKLMSRRQYQELGDQFEAREHQLFGKPGFEGIVDEIAGLEKGLGLYDLGQFTPR